MTIGVAQADSGMVTKASQFGVVETADRFVAAAEEAGLKIFQPYRSCCRGEEGWSVFATHAVDYFGSPKVGTALMTSDQRAGIDLPLKALVWRDADDKVWLGYNSPQFLFDRFGIDDRKR